MNAAAIPLPESLVESFKEVMRGRRRLPNACIFTPEQIAEVVHEANRAYQRIIGDAQISPPWPEAPKYQTESAISGIKDMAEEYDRTGGDLPFDPEKQHNRWLDHKLRAGWTFGLVKDEAKKTHPCCISYDALPIEQKGKDYIFFAVVTAMLQQRAPEQIAAKDNSQS